MWKFADGGMTVDALVVDELTSEIITIQPGDVRVNCRLASTGLIADGCIVSLAADK